jgi:hypothetical protein
LEYYEEAIKRRLELAKKKDYKRNQYVADAPRSPIFASVVAVE